jgi:hypothetical protein
MSLLSTGIISISFQDRFAEYIEELELGDIEQLNYAA